MPIVPVPSWTAPGASRSSSGSASGRARVYHTLGYATLRQYVEERLGLPYRSVARRARLEAKIWASPALQRARRQKLGFEKLWLLSFRPEQEIASTVARAKTMTVIALRRELESVEDVQMRGQGRVKAVLPRSVAYLLSAAIHTARARAGRAGLDARRRAVHVEVGGNARPGHLARRTAHCHASRRRMLP